MDIETLKTQTEAAIAAIIEPALDQAMQLGVASVQPSDGTVTTAQEQVDIAAAVKAAVDPLTAQVQALQTDDKAKTDLIASIQTEVGKLAALLVPAPVASS